MADDLMERIQTLMGTMDCPKHFECAESGFENLCKAADIGLTYHLACLEDDPPACVFSVSISGSYFCECPLRVYIAKNVTM